MKRGEATSELVADLRESYSSGESAASIAARLGVSESLVFVRTRDLRLSGRTAFAAEPVDWQDDAACIGTDVDTFVPDHPARTTIAQATRICTGCTVSSECYAYGLHSGSQGVWGGRYLGQRDRPERDEDAA